MPDPWSYSYWVTSLTGSFHVIAALLAIIIAPIMFFRHKGDARHKFLGRVWVVSMLTVDIGALLTYEISGKPNLFHFFAVLNLATLIPAWLYIRRYQKTRDKKYLAQHQDFMAWTYFGLVAAGTWQIVISLARIGTITLPYKYLYNGLGLITALASVMLFLYMRKRLKTIIPK